MLSRLVDVHDSFLEESDLPVVGDPDFVQVDEDLYNAIVDSGYHTIIKNGNIYVPDYHGLPGEAVLVDPGAPGVVPEPAPVVLCLVADDVGHLPAVAGGGLEGTQLSQAGGARADDCNSFLGHVLAPCDFV